jgi:aminoglycoside phosphotransferase (APT) family kinase protein
MAGADAGVDFDAAALARWLEPRLPALRGPIRWQRFAGGQSNPTWRMGTAGGDFVLRKQPHGTLTTSAHALDREVRALQALAGSAVPVPAVHVYCDDPAVIGTTFYVMDYCAGEVWHDPLLPDLAPDQRGRIYDAMNAALAALHTFDWQAAGLTGFGRPDGYFERQLSRWGRQNAALDSEPRADLDALAAWLAAHVPTDAGAALVHGDYRMGNLVCRLQPPGVVAVLDWELSTIGHPLADLAYNCLVWYLPAGHPVSPGVVGADLGALGIPGEEAYLAAYARRTGRAAIPDWRFHVAFSLYRIASIQRGVHARALAGNANSPGARRFGDSWPMVAATGLALARRAG